MSWLLRRMLKLSEVGAEGTELPGAPKPQGSDASPVEEDSHWGDLVADISEEPEEAAAEPTVPEEVAAPAEPVVETPEAPAEPVVAPELPMAPVTPAFTPEQIAEAKAQFHAALEKKYQFSEEDALGLQTEPEKVLPRLAAQLHAEILGDVMRQIQQTVPNMIQGVQASSTREAKAKDEFYGAWPDLRAHEDKVLAVGEMFRRMNPTASPQEAIKQIGRLTMVALGKDIAVQDAPPPPAKASFQPAATGRVASPVSAKSEWEQLIELDDD